MKALLLVLLLLCASPAWAEDKPHVSRSAKVGWTIVFGSVIAYELYAITNNKQTLSQGVSEGPMWFKVSLGVGLGAVSIHLFVG